MSPRIVAASNSCCLCTCSKFQVVRQVGFKRGGCKKFPIHPSRTFILKRMRQQIQPITPLPPPPPPQAHHTELQGGCRQQMPTCGTMGGPAPVSAGPGNYSGVDQVQARLAQALNGTTTLLKQIGEAVQENFPVRATQKKHKSMQPISLSQLSGHLMPPFQQSRGNVQRTTQLQPHGHTADHFRMHPLVPPGISNGDQHEVTSGNPFASLRAGGIAPVYTNN